jgi:hypothetical protein
MGSGSETLPDKFDVKLHRYPGFQLGLVQKKMQGGIRVAIKVDVSVQEES